MEREVPKEYATRLAKRPETAPVRLAYTCNLAMSNSRCKDHRVEIAEIFRRMNTKQKTRRPIGIDLFSGAGGMSLGFEQAGFDIAACVEYDPIHCAAHSYNFPECRTLCRDVSAIDGNELLGLIGSENIGVDVVFGGPPCQGFSLMGKRLLEDPRNRLVQHFVRLVSETGARYFVFENVRGLTVGRHQRFLLELIEEFALYGYRVRKPWHVLNASYYGVPQDRERLFLLGALEGLPLPEYPIPTSIPCGEKPELIGLPRTPTVLDAIGDLPDADEFAALCNSDSTTIAYGPPSEYSAKLRSVVFDPDDYSYRRKFDGKTLTSSLRTEHSRESQRRFAETEWGRTEPISRFFKLDPNGLCNTLRAGTASDHGAFTSPRPIHPFYPRCITVREAARLHSYPDWFRFHVTKWHGARQVGNSVPPLLARAVAAEVVKAMGLTPTHPNRTIELGDEKLLKMNLHEAAAYFGVSASVIPPRTRKDRAATVGKT